MTYGRLEGLVLAKRTLVVTGAGPADFAGKQLSEFPVENIVAEPVEGHGALLGVSEVLIEARGPEAVLTDHSIVNELRLWNLPF